MPGSTWGLGFQPTTGDGRVERQHRFDYLLGRFVPALGAAGFSAADVEQLLVTNPARALALPDEP